jgi:DNA primase
MRCRSTRSGISVAIPIYGTNGFTADHLDLLKREQVKRVVLALDSDEAGRRATDALKGKLEAAGITVRIASFPEGTKDANELLVSRNGDAREALRRSSMKPSRDREGLSLRRVLILLGLLLVFLLLVRLSRGRVRAAALPRHRLTALARGRHVPGPRALASPRPPSRNGEGDEGRGLPRRHDRPLRVEEPIRVCQACEPRARGLERSGRDGAPLARGRSREDRREERRARRRRLAGRAMGESRALEALSFLRRRDLLDQVAKDLDALGFVGEETNKRLLYLVAVSRKLEDPLSAIVLSQSGAGKSGLTEVIEKLCPPEDVVLLTRLTPQSLYYTEPGFLDRKLVIVEERYGSIEADYSIRVLQSRKKLIAAAPVKDPQTGNMRTKVFTVEARAAFIEATTASSVNHENATRCFELQMDETEAQTQRIHERQRLLRTGRGLELRQQAEAITRRHWNAQRLLEPLAVVIPFADKLSFPSSWMRTRRDHARFLNLIEVSAFLHQHQRERTAEGAIVASLADYEAAYAPRRRGLEGNPLRREEAAP